MIDAVLRNALASPVVKGELSRQIWEVLDVSEEFAVQSTLYMKFKGSDDSSPRSRSAGERTQAITG
jgi:hypothetical protein